VVAAPQVLLMRDKDSRKNKDASNGFDFLAYVLEKLEHQYPNEFLLGTPIPVKSVNQTLGRLLTMDKSRIRQVLKELKRQYGFVQVNSRYLRVKRVLEQELIPE
jgi:hypothetical protein